MTNVSWITCVVIGVRREAAEVGAAGSGVPRRRLSTPCSRRKTMFIASATNVVDMMLMPAIPGTMTSRSSWLDEKIAPNKKQKQQRQTKLKNASLFF